MQDNQIHTKQNGKKQSDKHDDSDVNKYFPHKGHSTYAYRYAWRRIFKNRTKCLRI